MSTTPAPATTCPSCGADAPGDGRYCLECGEPIQGYELVPMKAGAVAAAGTTTTTTEARRFAGLPGGVLLILLGLLLAAGVLGAVLLTDDDESATPTVTPTGSVPPTGTVPTAPTGTATETTPTDTTATETTPTETTDTTATETTPAVEPDDWPSGTSGFTVILKSLEQSEHEQSEAREFANGVSGSGVGVLDSSNYTSLQPGWWVVYKGQYSTAEAARSAAESERSGDHPDAYARQIRP